MRIFVTYTNEETNRTMDLTPSMTLFAVLALEMFGNATSTDRIPDTASLELAIFVIYIILDVT